MKTKLPHDRWFRNLALILAGGSLLLAIIDPSVRSLFVQAAMACVSAYIGRSL